MSRYDLEPTRRRGWLTRLDDGLLAVVVVVAAVFAFHLVGWLMGGLIFLVKLAIIAGLVFLVVGRVRRRR